MVTTVTTGTVSYFDEDTYAVRKVNTASRRFGMESGHFDVPAEARNTIRQKVSSLFGANKISYGDVGVEFPLEYVLIDARELSYGIDYQSGSTSGSDPYTHVISEQTPALAFTLPSRTIHTELAGITKQIDAAGCLLKDQEVKLAVTDPAGFRVKDTYIGQRVISSDNVVSNLFGATSGIGQPNEDMEFSVGANAATTVLKATGQDGGSLPNVIGEPSFRAAYQNNPRPFILPTTGAIVYGGSANLATGVNTGGTDITSAVKGLGMRTKFTYEFVRPNRSGTNNYGKPIQPYIMGGYITDRQYELSLILTPIQSVIDLFENPQLESLSDELFIKGVKDNNAADTISFMFASLGDVFNPLSSYEAMAGFVTDTQFHTVGYAPNELTTVAVNSNAALRSAT